MGRADFFRDCASRKTIRLARNEQAKNFKPGRLTERRERRESMRHLQSVAPLRRANMADHS